MKIVLHKPVFVVQAEEIIEKASYNYEKPAFHIKNLKDKLKAYQLRKIPEKYIQIYYNLFRLSPNFSLLAYKTTPGFAHMVYPLLTCAGEAFRNVSGYRSGDR